MDITNPPQQVGRYEIVGHLAAGGMAEIKLARIRGPSGFERPVVIKQILPHLARREAFVDMFLDEARIVSGIRHQNEVQVHELGQHGGELFLVMEYLEGEGTGSLIRRMRRLHRRLDYSVCAYLVAQACAGLHAAHETTDSEGAKQNLVHRDVSPQNIFLTYSGEVKLLDFGIAKAADRITKTEVGQIKGKYEYMSPEQCLSKPLDRRSDIFSLGSVLYELTTFRRPFLRENSLLTLRAICEEDLKPPSAFIPRYPPGLERICMKAMARDRDNRYATAAEMRRDLMLVANELTTSHALHDDLAALMQKVFADRIDEKAEMLRRVRAGSLLTHVPGAEADIEVDLELPTELESNATAAGLEVKSERSRRPLGWFLGGAAALVAVGVATWRVLAPSPPPVVPETLTAPVPSPIKSAEPVAPSATAEPAPAGSVTVAISSDPVGAEILIDGSPWGVSPASLKVPRSTDSVIVELRKTGFTTSVEHIVPDVDQRIRVTLNRKPKVVVHGGGTPAPTPTPTATRSAGPSFFRYD